MNKRSFWKDITVICVTALMVQLVFFVGSSQGQLRKVKVGDRLPEFTLPDANGAVYAYKHSSNKVMAIVYLSERKQSKRAIAGIEEIIKEYEKQKESFDLTTVVNDPNNEALLSLLKDRSWPNYHILIDEKLELWGKLGLIAMPTILISDKGGKVVWIKAGYGYDFISAVKQNLGAALGLISEPNQPSIEVKTLVHDTGRARAMRHLRMARMLEDKGRIKSAIKEVKKAVELDPNSIEAALALGELYCKSGKSEDAIEAVSMLEPKGRNQKAKSSLILGWANRQLNDLEKAEKFLLEAVKLKPKSARSLYELGKTYEAKGDMEKAVKAYHEVLSKIFTEPDLPRTP